MALLVVVILAIVLAFALVVVLASTLLRPAQKNKRESYSDIDASFARPDTSTFMGRYFDEVPVSELQTALNDAVASRQSQGSAVQTEKVVFETDRAVVDWFVQLVLNPLLLNHDVLKPKHRIGDSLFEAKSFRVQELSNTKKRYDIIVHREGRAHGLVMRVAVRLPESQEQPILEAVEIVGILPEDRIAFSGFRENYWINNFYELDM